MDSRGVLRPFVALTVVAATACSIWAAVDDPYKANTAGMAMSEDAGATSGDSSLLLDGGEAGMRSMSRVVDAGFTPYGIAAFGDTVYVVDDQSQIHVAYEAGTSFTTFWSGDAGDVFFIQTNDIATSVEGVFWTVSAGIRFCSHDGGGCGFLPSSDEPKAIAARGPIVAWIDNTGVRVCRTGLANCNPVPGALAASKSAQRLAVGPIETVAWTDGGTRIHFESPSGSTFVDLQGEATLVATDESSGELAWVGPTAVGRMPFDGGPGELSRLTSVPKPTALFAGRGAIDWSLHASNSVSSCRFDDAGICAPIEYPSGLGALVTTSRGIVADSREVLAVFSSDNDNHFRPVLVAWRLK